MTKRTRKYGERTLIYARDYQGQREVLGYQWFNDRRKTHFRNLIFYAGEEEKNLTYHCGNQCQSGYLGTTITAGRDAFELLAKYAFVNLCKLPGINPDNISSEGMRYLFSDTTGGIAPDPIKRPLNAQEWENF